jgi:chorismate synthase
MAGNTFGEIFKVTTFGESHGKALGGVIDGCPAGLALHAEDIQGELNRRRPGQSRYTTPRDEKDKVELLSGVFQGKTTGTPIGFLVWNSDQKSKDYDHLKDTYRPSHADFVYDRKYGRRDHRGGGRSSARETVARVVAGAVARMLLLREGVEVKAYVSAMGPLKVEKPYHQLDLTATEESLIRCPDLSAEKAMKTLIEETAEKGDTLGGTISCIATGVPAGLGEPVFDKLHADLGKAMLSINAVKGFEYGSGFAGTGQYGSTHNDRFIQKEGAVETTTNNSGGIQGGISNGQDIVMRVGFKPIATIMDNQKTINNKGDEVLLEGKGRHDVTVLPRAVPIVEAMAAIVLADHLLRNKIYEQSITK